MQESFVARVLIDRKDRSKFASGRIIAARIGHAVKGRTRFDQRAIWNGAVGVIAEKMKDSEVRRRGLADGAPSDQRKRNQRDARHNDARRFPNTAHYTPPDTKPS